MLTIDIATDGCEYTVKAFWRSRQFVAVGGSLLGATTDLIDSLTAAGYAEEIQAAERARAEGGWAR